MSTTPAVPGPAAGKSKTRRSVSAYIRAFRRLGRRKVASSDPEAMTILQHMNELRIRLSKAGIALAVATAVSFYYSGTLIDVITAPLGGRQALVSIELTENISVFMRVSLLGGVIIGFPLILYQIISYFAPALSRRERKWLYFLVPLATIFFLGGASFAWFVMIPVAIPFLTNFLSIPTDPRPLGYVSFVTTIVFWIGISFEMPLIIFFMAKLGWVTARQLLQGWRYAIMGIATLAAVVTPTVDPINMSITMAPLLVLYLISIILAWIA